MRRTFSLFAVIIGASLTAGCAPQAVIVKPPALATSGAPIAPQGQAWSLWVSEARDVRPADRAGNRVGTFYTRFRKKPQAAYLEPNPEVYLSQQLSRYLLSKGWEASSRDAARAQLQIDVEDFSMVEDPGSVWDTVTVKVAYVVHVLDRSGRELGRVRLEGGGVVKTPGDSQTEVSESFRSAVADTFEALARSDAFHRALGAAGP